MRFMDWMKLKAFSGVGSEGGGNDVTTRLFGQFLTWMQEKKILFSLLQQQ